MQKGEIKAVKEAFSAEPVRWEVNQKSKLGIQKILMEVEKINSPSDFTKQHAVYRAYDTEGNKTHQWNVDSVNVEYF